MLISKEIENHELIHLIMSLKKKSNPHINLVWNHLLPLSVSSRIPIVERPSESVSIVHWIMLRTMVRKNGWEYF